MDPAMLLLLLAGGYLIYQSMQPTAPAPPATPPPGTPLKTAGGPAVPSGAPGTTVVGAPASPTPPPPQPSQTFNSLANTYARWVANVNQNKTDPAITMPNNVMTASYDVWNYYLAQVTGVTLPYAWDVNPRWTGSTQLGMDAYWSGVARWLSAHAGMSGLRSIRIPAYMSGGWR